MSPTQQQSPWRSGLATRFRLLRHCCFVRGMNSQNSHVVDGQMLLTVYDWLLG